jgi:hypothetical protein
MQDDQTRRLDVFAPIDTPDPFLDSADLAAVYSQPRLIVSRMQQVREQALDSAPSRTYALRFRPPPSAI